MIVQFEVRLWGVGIVLRSHAEGEVSVCQLWYVYHRFAVTGINSEQDSNMGVHLT